MLIDEMEIRLATALANCSPFDKSFIQNCQRDYQLFGKLTDSQAKEMSLIYWKIRQELVRQNIAKRDRWR